MPQQQDSPLFFAGFYKKLHFLFPQTFPINGKTAQCLFNTVPSYTVQKSSNRITDWLDSAGNFVGTQATGAGMDVAGSAIRNNLYTSDVGLPSSVGSSVRVGNSNTESNAFAANIAFSHVQCTSLAINTKSQREYDSRKPKEKQDIFSKKSNFKGFFSLFSLLSAGESNGGKQIAFHRGHCGKLYCFFFPFAAPPNLFSVPLSRRLMLARCI